LAVAAAVQAVLLGLMVMVTFNGQVAAVAVEQVVVLQQL
jgi:hypothetical protein